MILVLEVKLYPNQTLQLTTSLGSHWRWFCGDSVTDVQWLVYLQYHGCYYMLLDACRCDPFQRCSTVIYLQDHGCKMV